MRSIARAVVVAILIVPAARAVAHDGGLNKCGCHFNRKTGITLHGRLEALERRVGSYALSKAE